MEEARKFLDLDMVAEQIRDAGDQAMFREAVQCYHIGSYRAAVILVWIATTNCLYRFLEHLHNEGDGVASQAFRTVNDHRDKSTYEETLVTQCRKCELLSDYEERCLKFIRDTRNKSSCWQTRAGEKPCCNQDQAHAEQRDRTRSRSLAFCPLRMLFTYSLSRVLRRFRSMRSVQAMAFISRTKGGSARCLKASPARKVLTRAMFSAVATNSSCSRVLASPT